MAPIVVQVLAVLGLFTLAVGAVTCALYLVLDVRRGRTRESLDPALAAVHRLQAEAEQAVSEIRELAAEQEAER